MESVAATLPSFHLENIWFVVKPHETRYIAFYMLSLALTLTIAFKRPCALSGEAKAATRRPPQ